MKKKLTQSQAKQILSDVLLAARALQQITDAVEKMKVEPFDAEAISEVQSLLVVIRTASTAATAITSWIQLSSSIREVEALKAAAKGDA